MRIFFTGCCFVLFLTCFVFVFNIDVWAEGLIVRSDIPGYSSYFDMDSEGSSEYVIDEILDGFIDVSKVWVEWNGEGSYYNYHIERERFKKELSSILLEGDFKTTGERRDFLKNNVEWLEELSEPVDFIDYDIVVWNVSEIEFLYGKLTGDFIQVCPHLYNGLNVEITHTLLYSVDGSEGVEFVGMVAIPRDEVEDNVVVSTLSGTILGDYSPE